MIPRLVAVLVLLPALVAAADHTRAGSAEPDTPRVRTTLSLWESTGDTTWSHDASGANPRFGDPTSKLEYDDVDSTIVELRARVDLPERFFLELAYGAGDAQGGRLTDADYVSGLGAEAFGTAVPGAHAYSETVSILDGNSVSFFDVRAGRLFYRSPGGRTAAGLAARYLDWSEKYSARGVNQTICTAPGRLCLPQGTAGFTGTQVIYNDARWRAAFIGVWGRHRLGDSLELSGELAFAPLADLNSDDKHLLRSDLGTDPSFRLEGQGTAATAQLDATYHINSRLAASVGVRYWWAEVRNEARGFTAFPAVDAPYSARLNSFETQRYGLTLSVSYALSAVD